MRVVIVTGLSGAGKTTALRVLEDLQYYTSDNPPIPVLFDLVEVLAGQGIENAALAIDSRQKDLLSDYPAQVKKLEDAGHSVEVLYLEARDAILVRRYSETRRRHPLSGDAVSEGITKDREVLKVLRLEANVLNTEHLNVHELKDIISERYGHKQTGLAVTLQSFGFKNGVPVEADMVFDLRFLPNPYFDEELRPLDGLDKRISDYVLGTEEGTEITQRLEELLKYLLPKFLTEGKRYLTVAVGCTGGKHRSVSVVEELRKRLTAEWGVLVRHRDLNRASQRRRDEK